MALGHTKPIGLRQVVLTKINEDGTEGAKVELPASRTFTFTPTADVQTLEGGDAQVDAVDVNKGGDWELEGGGVSMDVYAFFTGAPLVSSGTGATEERTMDVKSSNSAPYFKAEGRIVNSSGVGALQGYVSYARVTGGGPQFSAQNGEYMLTNASGRFFEHPTTKSLWGIKQKATDAALALT